MKWLNSNRIRLLLIGVVATIVLGSGSAKADFTFGTPKNLGRTVNSGSYDGSPCLSSDGLELYFTSARKGGYGLDDIWVSTRQTIEDEWGEPNNLGELVNSALGEDYASISTDGLELYFYRWEYDPGTTYYIFDIWVTKRAEKGAFWGQPEKLELTIPDGFMATTPSISADGLELYLAMCRFGDDANEADIYVTRRETMNSAWGELINLDPLVNDGSCKVNPRISNDGLLLVFFDWWACSPRPGGFGNRDMWIVRRATRDDDWSPPLNLGSAINSTHVDREGMISADGSTLYFSSNRFSSSHYYIHYDIYEAPVLPVVDFDGDGIVATNDLLMLIESWDTDDSQCDIGPMAWGDGVVDEADLEVLMKYWGQDFNAPPEPVAHWKLDESEGTIAYDNAGSNDASLVGDPVWQPIGGLLDGALELDGIEDGAESGFLFDPMDTAFSAFVWVKGSNLDQVIISQAKGQFGKGVNWLMTDTFTGNLMTEFQCLDENWSPHDDLLSSTQITDSQWHHVGLVWDSLGTRILYVDGIEVAKDTVRSGMLLLEDGGINIGFQASILHRPGYWSGLIDDVRIYNQALSAEQIAALTQ